jgi:hypothetical protein
MRLKENQQGKAKAAGKSSTGGPPSGFTSQAWDGSATRWPDAASYADSCLINLNTGPRSQWTKGKCKLPVQEPNGDYNVNAVHAAAAALAGGRGGVAAPPAAKKAAAKKLVTLYGRMHADAPPAIKQMAS